VLELSTTISNLRHLRESDLSPYDAVYLGNVYCRRYEANLLERPAELGEAIRLVRSRGKRPRLTTYAAIRTETLPAVRRALHVAAAEGADAVEVHTLGLVKLVRDELPGLPVHVGHFANVYTDAGVELLEGFGVARITPSHELTLDEVDALAGTAGVPLEIAVHGKLPLGVSDSCVLLAHEAAWGVHCPDLCQREVFLRKDDWGLKSVGTGILSGRDFCLLEHLPRLLAAGHRHFRIDAVSESPAYRLEVGAVYRDALDHTRPADAEREARWWETLRRHSRLGLCNGYAFGLSGHEYVGAAARAAGAPAERAAGAARND
jgi:putative protease